MTEYFTYRTLADLIKHCEQELKRTKDSIQHHTDQLAKEEYKLKELKTLLEKLKSRGK